MNFQEAQKSYAALEQAFQSGSLSEPDYQDRLREIHVIDSSGARWEIQAHTGEWFVYRNGQWQASAPAARRKASRALIVVEIVVAVLLCSGAIAGLVVAWQTLTVSGGNPPVLPIFNPDPTPTIPFERGRAIPPPEPCLAASEAPSASIPPLRPPSVFPLPLDKKSDLFSVL